MNEVILPIAPPEVDGYQFYALPLAILANYDESKSWIYSNFIQTCFDKKLIDSPVPFCFYMYDPASCPWLKYLHFDRDIFLAFNQDIVTFIIESLNREYYIYLNIDEYFIPERKAYQRYNSSHDILVYGYNLGEEVFLTLGYNNENQLKTTKVPFQLFLQAFNNLDNIINYCTQINLYKFQKNSQYHFNLKLVIETLEDYLFSQNTSERFSMLREPWDRAYGMEGYQYFRQYISLMNDNNSPLVRDMHVLWEHKKLMTSRIKYMELNGYLSPLNSFSNNFSKIETMAMHIRNKALYYSIKKDPVVLDNITKLIDQLAHDEYLQLENLLKHLKMNTV